LEAPATDAAGTGLPWTSTMPQRHEVFFLEAFHFQQKFADDVVISCLLLLRWLGEYWI
jgi:hypothetical protein